MAEVGDSRRMLSWAGLDLAGYCTRMRCRDWRKKLGEQSSNLVAGLDGLGWVWMGWDGPIMGQVNGKSTIEHKAMEEMTRGC